MCGFDSNFYQSVFRKVCQVVSHTKLEIIWCKMFFNIFGLILADSKSGEILMPNVLIALGFCSYK